MVHPEVQKRVAFANVGLLLRVSHAAAGDGVTIDSWTVAFVKPVSYPASDTFFTSTVRTRSGTAVQVQNLLAWQS